MALPMGTLPVAEQAAEVQLMIVEKFKELDFESLTNLRATSKAFRQLATPLLTPAALRELELESKNKTQLTALTKDKLFPCYTCLEPRAHTHFDRRQIYKHPYGSDAALIRDRGFVNTTGRLRRCLDCRLRPQITGAVYIFMLPSTATNAPGQSPIRQVWCWDCGKIKTIDYVPSSKQIWLRMCTECFATWCQDVDRRVATAKIVNDKENPAVTPRMRMLAWFEYRAHMTNLEPEGKHRPDSHTHPVLGNLN